MHMHYACADTAALCRYTHARLCGYGLSTGPTDSLSSWWLRNRSPPDSQQQQQRMLVWIDASTVLVQVSLAVLITFVFSASEMTYIVSSGALNSTHYYMTVVPFFSAARAGVADRDVEGSNVNGFFRGPLNTDESRCRRRRSGTRGRAPRQLPSPSSLPSRDRGGVWVGLEPTTTVRD